MHARLLSSLLLCAALLFAAPDVVQAQVTRCVAADGTLVYTDRKCEDIGATRHLGTTSAGGMATGRYRSVCARTVQDLVYSFSSALQSGDVNQVAAVYDWAGMPTASGYRLMARLEAVARRPLVDVQPMYAGGTNAYGDDVVEFDEATGAVITRAPRKPRLIGLRVEQTLANGTTPSRTTFGLRQRMGCWWVRL